MCLLSDEQIKHYAYNYKLIEPFEEHLITSNVISFGLSSYGYDLRLSTHFKRLSSIQNIDIKNIKPSLFLDEEADNNKILLNPFENILARSYEYFKIPRDILGLCLGKSTYARLGVIINATPLEPEWEGFINLSIINCTKNTLTLYAGEGIAQVIFFKAAELCKVSYNDRKGKYQKQNKIEIPKI